MEKFTLTHQISDPSEYQERRLIWGFPEHFQEADRGSFPQNHVPTLLCLLCYQLTNPEGKSAPCNTEPLLKMGFKGHLCKIFTLPQLPRIKRAASHWAERRQVEPGKETSRVQWASLSLPHLNPLTDSLESPTGLLGAHLPRNLKLFTQNKVSH